MEWEGHESMNAVFENTFADSSGMEGYSSGWQDVGHRDLQRRLISVESSVVEAALCLCSLVYQRR